MAALKLLRKQDVKEKCRVAAAPNNEQEIRAFLLDLFQRAVDAAAPEHCVAQHLPSPPAGRTLLIAAGKAAASMAYAAEQAWPDDALLSGIALTRYGHGKTCERIEVIEASHPVPDNRGHEAAQRLLTQVEELGADDLLLFLVSGGGSSLLALPAPGISLEEKKAVNQALLMSGAPIGEMNCVRKHLSSIKGGRLAKAAQPAQVVTLAISDVPGDDPSTIASGPTVPDPTTLDDMHGIAAKYQLILPNSDIKNVLKKATETPKSSDSAFASTSFACVATPSTSLDHVLAYAKTALAGAVLSLGADVEGEASLVAKEHAKLALEADEPTLILSGGETTVTVATGSSPGKGGRNCEYLLALAIALDGAAGIYALAADTDGIDGSEDNAGAIIAPDTLQRAKALGLDAEAMLARHDAYSFFEALGDLIITGPTLTNVNDFRAIWISG